MAARAEPERPDEQSGGRTEERAEKPSGGRVDRRFEPGMRRRRALWMLGGGAVGVTLAGLASSQVVRSPAQQVADSAPPALTTLTVPVQLRVLTDTVVLRGTVGAGTTVEVTPVPAEGGRAVVTGVRVDRGEEFDAGTVLVEVSGRPVIALPGELPAYRDLRPGMSGDDVAQLQAALAEVGHDPGGSDGEFGPGTSDALAAFYDELGYQAPTTGPGGEQELSAAEAAIRQAERTLDEARAALDRLEEAPPTPAPGEPDPVDQAERQVRYAEEDLAAAREARDEVARTTGSVLLLSEAVFLPGFPARVERLNGDVGTDLTTLEGPLLTVFSGALLVRASLNPAQRELLDEGLAVEILSELLGESAAGEITSIGELTADETGQRGYPMVVSPVDEPLGDDFAGADVRLTVEAASTDGEVLVVPLSAVFTGADGGVAVLRRTAAGTQERIPVTPGVSGDGYVAVTPVDAELAAGDEVVVGAGGSRESAQS